MIVLCAFPTQSAPPVTPSQLVDPRVSPVGGRPFHALWGWTVYSCCADKCGGSRDGHARDKCVLWGGQTIKQPSMELEPKWLRIVVLILPQQHSGQRRKRRRRNSGGIAGLLCTARLAWKRAASVRQTLARFRAPFPCAVPCRPRRYRAPLPCAVPVAPPPCAVPVRRYGGSVDDKEASNSAKRPGPDGKYVPSRNLFAKSSALAGGDTVRLSAEHPHAAAIAAASPPLSVKHFAKLLIISPRTPPPFLRSRLDAATMSSGLGHDASRTTAAARHAAVPTPNHRQQSLELSRVMFELKWLRTSTCF